MIIVALLWLTISYYSARVVPSGSFLLLFVGLFLLIYAEWRHRGRD